MILGNYALERGWDPGQVTDWFHRAFVDGYDWVMVPNVVGMSQYADGGLLATKPYAAGGAYISRMSNYCVDCPYDPKKRVGADACPFTVRLLGLPGSQPRTPCRQPSPRPTLERPATSDGSGRAPGAGDRPGLVATLSGPLPGGLTIL